MIGLVVIAVAGIWCLGGWHLWRLQSAWRAKAGVNGLDRAIAILWLPIALYFLLISLPILARQGLRDIGRQRARDAARHRKAHRP
ncbi:hypothetical protein [Sphingobium bisphenolivorans]|uniref:hypothetical protein n=1 Tax=Sphingobium bisphenolivorans TaxID=1335760 RepID=UPI0003B7B360|nr:hypothetical protein [Sphingobium bisphenolivorans]